MTYCLPTNFDLASKGHSNNEHQYPVSGHHLPELFVDEKIKENNWEKFAHT
jgi:hypothetical protein